MAEEVESKPIVPSMGRVDVLVKPEPELWTLVAGARTALTLVLTHC